MTTFRRGHHHTAPTHGRIPLRTPEVSQGTASMTSSWSAGDLRGIPVIGQGVTGAIPGTSPHTHGTKP